MRIGDFELIGKSLLIKSGKERVLALADLHLGYQESLVNSGVLVPGSLFEDIKKELYEILERVGKVDKIIIVGDLKHEFGRIMNAEWKEVVGLIDILKENCDEIVIIKGNHDVIIGPLANRTNVKVVDYLIWKEYVFIHGDKDFPEIHDKKLKYWVMGHVHPAVVLEEGRKSEKYKCFLIGKYNGKEVVILPSFFPVSEGTDPRMFEFSMPWKMNVGSFEVYVVGENLEVLDFGKLRRI